MRRLAAALLLLSVLSPLLPANEETDVLGAARAASEEYQTRFRIIAEGLKSTVEKERLDTMRALAELRDPETLPLLIPFLSAATHSVDELIMACTVLGRLGYQSPLPSLRQLLRHEHVGVRQAAILAIDQIGAIAAGDWMARAKDSDEALQLASVTRLGALKHAEAGETLVKGLGHPKSLVRQAACIGIGQLGDRALGDKLRASLTDADPAVRRYAAEALARLNFTPAIADLLMALDANVAGDHIVRALRILTNGQDFGFATHAPLHRRQEAIERGFAWLAQHPELAK